MWALDLGFSNVCKLLSIAPGTAGEGAVNGSCHFCLEDIGAVLSRGMICSDLLL